MKIAQPLYTGGQVSYRSIPVEGTVRRLQSLESEIYAQVEHVIASGKYNNGPQVAALEEEVKSLWGYSAVAVNSGTSALEISLMAAGIKAGDEVILPALTFASTSFAVTAVGATPVFVDIDPIKMTIDPKAVKSAISDRTAAIIPVHLYGFVAEMQDLLEIGREHNLIIIEDCAQAHGAAYFSAKAGCLGDFGCFSLYSGKNVGGLGDGGLILVKNPELLELLYQLRDLGRTPGQRYCHERMGKRARMDDFDAAIVRVQLRRLETWNQRRQEIAKQYTDAFSHLPIQLPPLSSVMRSHVYYRYTLLCQSANETANLEQWLAENNIQTERVYPNIIPDQSVYQSLPCRITSIDVARDACERLLCLPMFPELYPFEVEAVIQAVTSFYKFGRS